MVIFLVVWCIISTVLLAFFVHSSIRFGSIIINLQEKLEESLDLIDEKYRIFSEIIEKPVFFDSVEIRQVISEIESTRRLLLMIANNLSNPESIDLETLKPAKKDEES